MLDVDCPRCGRVLLSTRRIERLRNTPAGIVVEWRCWCGRAGTLRTGRARPANARAA